MQTSPVALASIPVIALLGCAGNSTPNLRDTVIAIDPGHGGLEEGFVASSGLREKDINLDVALTLSEILQGWGARILLTRTDDSRPALDSETEISRRCDLVNAAQPTVLLSIHANGAAAQPKVRGFELWVARASERGKDEKSRQLASLIGKEMAVVWEGHDLGIRDDFNRRILRDTNCPGALVELEYLSNADAEQLLAQPAFRRRIAEAIAKAIGEWNEQSLKPE